MWTAGCDRRLYCGQLDTNDRRHERRKARTNRNYLGLDLDVVGVSPEAEQVLDLLQRVEVGA
eukprot:2113950-Pyramimonas_sp.AAC.1